VPLHTPTTTAPRLKHFGFFGSKTIMSIVSAGDYQTTAVAEGKLYRWGGCGTALVERDVPTLVGGAIAAKRVVATSAGVLHILALTDAGEVYAVGINTSGQLGLGVEYALSLN
jgi:alpha-tubulin suppressor-like RCC1 family protein